MSKGTCYIELPRLLLHYTGHFYWNSAKTGSPFVGKVSTPKSCWSGALTVNSKEETRKIACSASNYLSHCGNSRSKNDLLLIVSIYLN